MRAHFGLPSVESEELEGRPPINVKFEIPYFTTSGIQVRRKLLAAVRSSVVPMVGLRSSDENSGR